MSSILRLSSLASVRVLEVAEHLAVAGYGSRSALAKDKSALDHAGQRYLAYHKDAIASLDRDPHDPLDVLGYMRHVPRCGCPDHLEPIPKGAARFERTKHGRWPHYKEGIRVHWSFGTIGTRQNHRFTGTVDQAIRDALREWEMICGIRFQVVTDKSQANISARDGRIDGPQSTLAWSMLPWKGIGPNDQLTNNETGTSQLYDWDESWNDSPQGNISLKWVFFHEIGHALGWGHSPDKNDVMFAAYIPGRTNIPGATERKVAAEDYPGEPLRPDQPSPPTNPGSPKRGTVRLVNGMFSGEFEVIV